MAVRPDGRSPSCSVAGPGRLADHAPVSESYEGWHRVGGSRFDFYASDEEIAEWLLETLPAESAPYAVTGAEWIEEARRWEPFEYLLPQIREASRDTVARTSGSGRTSCHRGYAATTKQLRTAG